MLLIVRVVMPGWIMLLNERVTGEVFVAGSTGLTVTFEPVGVFVTVKVNDWVALEIPLDAVIVIGYVPPVPAAGVPLRVPEEDSVTPVGSPPVSENVAAG